MTVLLLTKSDDNECVERVTEALLERDADVYRLDSDRFPTELALTVERGPAGPAARLRDGDRVLDLAEVEAVWHRRLGIGRGLPDDMKPDLLQAARDESVATLLGCIASLPCFAVDPLHHIRRAKNKLLQLELARGAGLDVPRTVAGNDPETVRELFDACGGEIVGKTMTSFAVHDDVEEQVVVTNPVTQADLEHLDSLRFGPMTFQEKLDKRVELRATVVGRRVFTASIDSGRDERSRTDWRRAGADLVLDWQPAELPPDVESGLLELTRALGLNYGAADFVVTPEGRHVFLEINPVGEFFWLERHPGLPISEALADVLLGRVDRVNG
jgi:hypothetical protein